MYDITSEDSFTQVKKIKNEIEKELNKKDIPMALVAMKTDLESQVRLYSWIKPHFFQKLAIFARK